MRHVLVFDSVTKRFGGRAVLDSLSLSLGAGDVFALLGPNGAGKTTTLNLALGFLAPDAGRVRVCSNDVTSDPLKARRCIAYLPEQLGLVRQQLTCLACAWLGESYSSSRRGSDGVEAGRSRAAHR